MVTYEKEKNQALVEEYKNSGKSIRGFAEEKGIPTGTLQVWLNENQNLTFGAIEIKGSTPPLPRTIKPTTVFATENIYKCTEFGTEEASRGIKTYCTRIL